LRSRGGSGPSGDWDGIASQRTRQQGRNGNVGRGGGEDNRLRRNLTGDAGPDGAWRTGSSGRSVPRGQPGQRGEDRLRGTGSRERGDVAENRRPNPSRSTGRPAVDDNRLRRNLLSDVPRPAETGETFWGREVRRRIETRGGDDAERRQPQQERSRPMGDEFRGGRLRRPPVAESNAGPRTRSEPRSVPPLRRSAGNEPDRGGRPGFSTGGPGSRQQPGPAMRERSNRGPSPSERSRRQPSIGSARPPSPRGRQDSVQRRQQVAGFRPPLITGFHEPPAENVARSCSAAFDAQRDPGLGRARARREFRRASVQGDGPGSIWPSDLSSLGSLGSRSRKTSGIG
jgi:hypothetical protein